MTTREPNNHRSDYVLFVLVILAAAFYLWKAHQ